MALGDERQLGFAEAFLGPKAGANRRLEAIEGLLDWSGIAVLVREVRQAETGRPPYLPLPMTKALLLQQWYGLSDPELAEALSDRLSFRRFCGFGLDAATPDDTTILRFRHLLGEKGLAVKVFAEINRQLDAQGLFVKRGTIIDATIVQASAGPRNARKDGTPVDPEARWAKRAKGSTLGYKAHVAADEGTGLVRAATLTPANVHDSRKAAELVQGDEAAVYADKAYDSAAFRAKLKDQKIADQVMYRARRNRPLKTWQTWMNKVIAPVRGGIERIFGSWKRNWGYRRVRYLGVDRNQAHLHLLAAAWNLTRAVALKPTG